MDNKNKEMCGFLVRSARMKSNLNKTNQIHNMAAAGLILRILDEEKPRRRDNYITALDGSRVGIDEARNLVVNIINGIVKIS